VKIVRWLDPLVLLAALGLAAATVAALAAEAWWGFELFTHFRAHYVALQLPLVAVLAARGRRRFAAVLAVLTVPNLWPLLPYLPGAASAPALAAGTSIELMAVNVEWKNRSSERLLETIRTTS